MPRRRPSSPRAQARLFADQLRYYRAQAADWGDWVERKGRFAQGRTTDEAWLRDLEALRGHLRRFRASGDVLELACGPGTWTRVLIETADSMTVVDAAEEMLDANRRRCERLCVERGIEYRVVQADLYRWQTDQRYDSVSFCFWLSHVPDELFELFWLGIARVLRGHGRFFFMDARPTHDGRGPLRSGRGHIVVRRARNGRRYRLVQVLRDPRELRRRLNALGFHARVIAVGQRFLCGWGQPSAARRATIQRAQRCVIRRALP